MAAVSITRKELYDQVWSEPMLRLAKRYGISDVGLAKICRKHRIPCPPRGYWAKKAAGQTPAQSPLPKPDDNPEITIYESPESDPGPPLSDELRELVFNWSEKPFQIDVRDHLRGAHRLVSEANQELHGPELDSEGLIDLPEKPLLHLRVSKALLRRSLFILDALLRALEAHGDQAAPDAANALHGCDSICLCTSPIDADLQAVIEAWAALPAPIRAAVLALIRSQDGAGE